VLEDILCYVEEIFTKKNYLVSLSFVEIGSAKFILDLLTYLLHGTESFLRS